MIPNDTIDKLEAIWTSVSWLGADLDEREWKLPTDLAGWSVQDNLAHMIGTERKLQGLPAATPLDDFGGHVKNTIGKFNEPATPPKTISKECPSRAWRARPCLD